MTSQIKKWFSAIIVSVCLAVPSTATTLEDTKRRASAQLPFEMMQKLAPMLGRWQLDTEISNDAGKTWKQMSSQYVNVVYRRKDLLLAELPEDADGPGFKVESYLTYDQYEKTYRKAAIGDGWGIMDIYEGGIENEEITLSNLESGTLFPLGENVYRGFRLIMEIKRPMRTMLIEKTDDGGETWQANFRLTYHLIE